MLLDSETRGNAPSSENSSSVCHRCHRPLSDPVSVRAGLGPVCRAKGDRRGTDAGDANDGGTVADLPFDPDAFDIVCRRDHGRMEGPAGDGMHFNISQRVVVHSPTGFEWGYGGSGPADFALNILDLYARHRLGEHDEFQAGRGPEGHCTQFAWDFHHDFKREFVARLPDEGGTITGAAIERWVAERYTAWALERSLVAVREEA